jgi:hypothetical protein
MTSKGNAIKAAMEVAEDVAAGKLDPADLDRAALDECRALFGNVCGPGDPLWELHVEIARTVLGLGGIPSNELQEWLAVQRRRDPKPEPPIEQLQLAADAPADDASDTLSLPPSIEPEAPTSTVPSIAQGSPQDASDEQEPEPEVNPYGPARGVVARGRGWPADNGLREV